MKTYDSPFVADWFAVSLRWIILLGLVTSLGLADQMLVWMNLLLIPVICWNVAMNILAGGNKRLALHRELSLVIDSLFAILFYIAHGGFSGPVFWVVVLPIIIATIYFEWRGALLAAIFMTALEATYTLLPNQGMTSLIVTGIAAVLTLGTGAMFGFISRQMFRNMRKFRNNQIEQREREQAARDKAHEVENQRIRAIFNLTSTLTATLNYERVLETALDLSLTSLSKDPEAGSDRYLIAAVLLFSGETLIVGSARRFSQADMRTTFPARQGSLLKVIEEVKPLLIPSVTGDPELSKLISLSNSKAIYLVPLRSGYNIYGVMLFAHPEPNFFISDRRDVIDILTHQLVIAVQNARLYQDLASEKERITEVQEEARKKLARDLHDGPTQSVSAIAMRVNLARRMLERDVKSAADELVKIEELARRTTKEIRHMLFTLRPLVLESEGLTAALKAMAEKTKETFGQEVVIKVDDTLLPELEMGKQGVIFYLAEEAVNNARKHAQAAQIFVRLRQAEPGIAMLEIADNGLGFDVESVMRSYDKRGSLGMINLRERTELINGLLNITSAPGKGTKIQVYIPLNEEAADRIHQGRAQSG